MPDQEIQNLGALERTPDARDINLGMVQAPEPYPATFLEDVSNLPTYYQAKQPACGPHAGAWFMVRKVSREVEVPQDYSPKFGWIEIKTFDGYPLDAGTDMRSIFKWLKNIGPCDGYLLPNTVEQTLADYSSPQQITQEMITNAAIKKILKYAFLDSTDFESLKQKIWQNKEVLLLLKVDSGFFGTVNTSFTTPKWGHFVTAFNYDEDNILIKDSTEKDPALSIKRINRRYITPTFVREVGTAIDIPDWLVSGLTSQYVLIRKLAALYAELYKTKRSSGQQ